MLRVIQSIQSYANAYTEGIQNLGNLNLDFSEIWNSVIKGDGSFWGFRIFGYFGNFLRCSLFVLDK